MFRIKLNYKPKNKTNTAAKQTLPQELYKI